MYIHFLSGSADVKGISLVLQFIGSLPSRTERHGGIRVAEVVHLERLG
jgi:hypothetical protein